MSDNLKQPAGDVLQTGSRRAPRRFSRKVVLSVSVAAIAFASGTLIYGLFHQPAPSVTKTAETTPNASNAPFGNLVNGYPTPEPQKPSTAPTPKPDAPLQAREGGTAAEQAQPPGEHKETEEERLAKAALTGGLFFDRGATGGEGGAGTLQPGPAAASQSDPHAARQGAAYGVGASGNGPTAAVANAEANNSFLASQSDTGSVYAKPMQSPVSPYQVQAGSVLPGALLTKSISDLPGDVTGQITENVYDTATGKYLLIPQGSRIIGRYSSMVAYGQNRSLIVWNRLILPNSKSESLGGMVGTDAEGASGMTGDVNHHIWSLAGALAFATVMSVGPSIASNLGQSSGGSGNTFLQYPAQYAGQQSQEIGQEFLSKELDRPNTITIGGGQTLRVLVNKDLILEPYQE